MGQGKNKMGRSDLTLLLLYSDNQHPIAGRTRFEKLIFLAQKEVLNKWEEIMASSARFDFTADRYGPFAVELYDELEYLRSVGMIDEQENNKYIISTRGNNFVRKKILSRVPKPIVNKLEELKKKWDRQDLENILKYVYSKYPEYTIKSQIRSRILH